jgi:hypothetical protein
MKLSKEQIDFLNQIISDVERNGTREDFSSLRCLSFCMKDCPLFKFWGYCCIDEEDRTRAYKDGAISLYRDAIIGKKTTALWEIYSAAYFELNL